MSRRSPLFAKPLSLLASAVMLGGLLFAAVPASAHAGPHRGYERPGEGKSRPAPYFEATPVDHGRLHPLARKVAEHKREVWRLKREALADGVVTRAENRRIRAAEAKLAKQRWRLQKVQPDRRMHRF